MWSSDARASCLLTSTSELPVHAPSLILAPQVLTKQPEVDN